MRTFVELFDRDRGNLAADAARREEFPPVCAEVGIRYWRPGDPIRSRGTRILLCVGSFSRIDMEILDAIVGVGHTDTVCASVNVEVFDVLDCKSAEDFEQYYPEPVAPSVTPFAGLWTGGQYVRSGGPRFVYEVLRDLAGVDLHRV